ncbi:MAG: HD domain-containing protein [Gammaproteobacteria bacterium]|nr:HD domain-containing protein [Gammaproteobacteria bacterium]
MVQIRLDLPQQDAGRVDLDAWKEGLDECDRQKIHAATELIPDEGCREFGFDLAQLLVDLELDADAVATGLVYETARTHPLSSDSLQEALGTGVANLVDAMLRMAGTSEYQLSNLPMLGNEARNQVDNVRNLLVALIDDPRVAVIKLAERVIALRMAKSMDEETVRRLAREALRIFAPLAGRLGVWQIKWALEDLAFRHLHPGEYKRIATSLDARRHERERRVGEIVAELKSRLAEAGIDAEVIGRAKHIYSIWRKMRRKAVDLSQVYDMEAVRVIVDDVQRCYGALGVVHTAWPHIGSEFDDYVASPKDNGYQSIHTAVMGPEGRVLEVQIRSREMHRQAEIGLCAHWAYKDERRESLHSDKMSWLRRVLEWHDDVAELADLSELEADPVSIDRIYVATPQGHVLDLTQGATPVDFAYRVHTEIGHRCVGARADGVPVPLNASLATGQKVEIITGETEQPRREWLNPALGFVKTSRARMKIQSWFRDQIAESNVAAGRGLLEDTLRRLDLAVDPGELAREAGYASENELWRAVGVGECQIIDLVRLMGGERLPDRQLSLLPAAAEREAGSVQEIRIAGDDRQGLLRDITSVLAAMHIDVVSTVARADAAGENATVSICMRVRDILQLARAVDRLRRIPSVRDVRRS